jgi:acetyl esterase/lipase
MQADAKRAIAWMKAGAAQFGVDPNQIVVAGGSAGGHLALLAAYTANVLDLRPVDVGTADLSVCGVVSWYGPSDMRVYDAFAGQKFDTLVEEGQTSSSGKGAEWLNNRLGMNTKSPAHWQPGITVQENMMRGLFGGTVAEVPEEFRWGSPITHVGPHCPPTLLLQGEHDFVVSAEAVQLLADNLRQAGVPVVHVEYPQTDHAFDLILPMLSPSAQAALYETERFLALLTTRAVANGRETPFLNAPIKPVHKGVLVHTP